jgi:hypothetical protein
VKRLKEHKHRHQEEKKGQAKANKSKNHRTFIISDNCMSHFFYHQFTKILKKSN